MVFILIFYYLKNITNQNIYPSLNQYANENYEITITFYIDFVTSDSH